MVLQEKNILFQFNRFKTVSNVEEAAACQVVEWSVRSLPRGAGPWLSSEARQLPVPVRLHFTSSCRDLAAALDSLAR